MADDDRFARPGGHRYDAPEADDESRSRGWDLLLLGIVVVVLMVLVATGTVPIFGA